MQLLAVNNRKSIIDIECVKQATTLCDWQLEVRKLHDPIEADSAIAHMEQKIRRHLSNGPLTDRELKQKTNYSKKGIWVWDNAIKNLKRAREIRWDKKNKMWELCVVNL
jgi:hypothetical protein